MRIADLFSSDRWAAVLASPWGTKPKSNSDELIDSGSGPVLTEGERDRRRRAVIAEQEANRLRPWQIDQARHLDGVRRQDEGRSVRRVDGARAPVVHEARFYATPTDFSLRGAPVPPSSPGERPHVPMMSADAGDRLMGVAGSDLRLRFDRPSVLWIDRPHARLPGEPDPLDRSIHRSH